MSKATRERFHLPPLNTSKAPDRVVRVGDAGSVSLAREESASVRVVHDAQRAPGPAVAPEGAMWNNLVRRWFVLTDRGLVPLDPQPPPPEFIGRGVPPAVKVQA